MAELTELQLLLKKVEELDWSIYDCDDNIYELGKCSSAGQDFNINVDTENDPALFLDNLYKRYEDFDISEETYLWLDNSGHGANGAPYDMKDVYEDMEECRDNILELYNSLNDYYYSELYNEKECSIT